MSDGTARRLGRTMVESDPSWPAEPAAAPGTPNVVYCVLDDVGYSDFGCYGSEIETPNIDRLAAGGLRYTNFHTTSLCSPTRASLLTGRNHHAVGMGTLANYDLGFDGYRGAISRDAALLPEILRGRGWSNFAVGKWHLTPMHHTGPAGPFYQWPTQRGFDRFYGFMAGAISRGLRASMASAIEPSRSSARAWASAPRTCAVAGHTRRRSARRARAM